MKTKLASILLAMVLVGGVALSAFAETRVGDTNAAGAHNPYAPYTQVGDK
jgi:hypothetical protein